MLAQKHTYHLCTVKNFKTPLGSYIKAISMISQCFFHQYLALSQYGPDSVPFVLKWCQTLDKVSLICFKAGRIVSHLSKCWKFALIKAMLDTKFNTGRLVSPWPGRHFCLPNVAEMSPSLSPKRCWNVSLCVNNWKRKCLTLGKASLFMIIGANYYRYLKVKLRNLKK